MNNMLSQETLFLAVIFVAGEIMGNLLKFHQTLSEYDTFMHFAGGALVASLLATVLNGKAKEILLSRQHFCNAWNRGALGNIRIFSRQVLWS